MWVPRRACCLLPAATLMRASDASCASAFPSPDRWRPTLGGWGRRGDHGRASWPRHLRLGHRRRRHTPGRGSRRGVGSRLGEGVGDGASRARRSTSSGATSPPPASSRPDAPAPRRHTAAAGDRPRGERSDLPSRIPARTSCVSMSRVRRQSCWWAISSLPVNDGDQRHAPARPRAGDRVPAPLPSVKSIDGIAGRGGTRALLSARPPSCRPRRE